MMTPVETFRSAIRRQAVGMEIGGFRPPGRLLTSWFGRVSYALPGESWPCTDGKPMHPLCQINLTELPFRPPRLDDLELITVFVGPDELPTRGATTNGVNWCLRAYHNLAEVVPLTSPATGSFIKPFPMRPQLIEADYPCWPDIAAAVPPEIEDDYFDWFDNVPGFKMGGWPTLIQSEIFWDSGQKSLISPEYVFQIDTTEKGNWMWGDNGVGYFGRGTVAGRQNEWTVAWQCY